MTFELKVCPKRINIPELHSQTGVYVRAKSPEGKWGSYDIAELDGESLLKFLKSRGGKNKWAEDIVGICLGHGHLHPLEKPDVKRPH